MQCVTRQGSESLLPEADNQIPERPQAPITLQPCACACALYYSHIISLEHPTALDVRLMRKVLLHGGASACSFSDLLPQQLHHRRCFFRFFALVPHPC